jgi:nitrilase
MTRSNLPSWITGVDKEEKTSAVVNGRGASPPRLRRKSTIVEDGHEIVLPDLEKSGEQSQKVEAKPDVSDFVSRGGSSIISPQGEVLAGPLWDDENGLLTVDVDFDDCLRGRLDLDVGGSYSRYVLVSYLSELY